MNEQASLKNYSYSYSSIISIRINDTLNDITNVWKK